MSERNLSPRQFPVYEVGGPEHHAPERGYHSTQYGPEHQVHPTEAFGVPRVRGIDAMGGAPPGTRYQRYDEPYHDDVPLDQVSVSQSYVYEPHVHDLASVPQAVLNEGADTPVSGDWHNGRVIVHEGTHGTVAAKVRGDSTVRVRIDGQYMPES